MKRFILPGLAVILSLVGGGVGVMKWMQLGPFAPEEIAESSTPAESRKREPPRYVDVEPLNIALIMNERPRAIIQISAKLEVENDKAAMQVHKKMTKLTSALVVDLHDFLPRVLREADHIDLDLLKERMQYVADKTFGQGLIKQVLIQSVHDGGGKS
jgi:flagellar basal body-associated protein FliL